MKRRDYIAVLIVVAGFMATSRIFSWSTWVDQVESLGTAAALALFLLPAAYVASPEKRTQYGEKWLWGMWFVAAFFLLMELLR